MGFGGRIWGLAYVSTKSESTPLGFTGDTPNDIISPGGSDPGVQMGEKLVPSPRDFYRYINNERKDTQGIPPLKKKNGSGITQSDFDKTGEFNGQFTDVFTKTVHNGEPSPASG